MPRLAVIVTFDRFHLGCLGPYGNDWIETPQWNRFASEAVTFDQCLGEPRTTQEPTHPWWQSGRWLTRLRQQGIRRVLVTDTLLPSSVAAGFDEILPVTGQDGLDYSEVDGTPAKLMTAAANRIDELGPASESTLVWIRSRGIARPWLPPREFVELYLEEFRLDASRQTGEEPGVNADAAGDSDADETDQVDAIVSATIDQDPDADAVLHAAPVSPDLPVIRAMYAASASYVDRWLAKVFASLSRVNDPPLIILTAAAGEELGEHGEAGAECDDPWSPNLHVPLIVHWPGTGDGSRRDALVTSADVPATLCDWFDVPPPETGHSLGPLCRSEIDAVREEVLICTEDYVGLRTPDSYYLRKSNVSIQEQQESTELFQKPADRWDLANLAQYSPGLVDEMESRLAELIRLRESST